MALSTRFPILEQGQMEAKPTRRSPPMKLPLSFDKAVEGLLAVKPKKPPKPKKQPKRKEPASPSTGQIRSVPSAEGDES